MLIFQVLSGYFGSGARILREARVLECMFSSNSPDDANCNHCSKYSSTYCWY